MEDITGRQLGPYRIVAALGRGGMAAVYKAFQPSMERYVALKILPRYYADDPEFSGRFVQEARLIASLQHPHILPVHDFGEADGYRYLVMPLIEGGTLARHLQPQIPLPLSRIRLVVSQVGDALDYAHSRGIVHRDVKPSNVLLDRRGNCLLSDFGVAKIVEGNLHFTRTGGVVGTPTYMSPEQGLGRTLDHRSDIYGLGVVLYEMAAGCPPFQADTPIAVMLKHAHDPLPLPRLHNPELPVAVETVILKALAKEPADRYQSAGAMVEALQKAIDRAKTMLAPAAPTVAVEPPPSLAQEPGPPTATAVAPATTEPDAGSRAVGELGSAVPGARRAPWRLLDIGALFAVVLVAAVAVLLARGGDGQATAVAPVGERLEEEEDAAGVAAVVDEATAAAEAEAILQELEGAYEAGDMERAIALLSRATELDPQRAELYCALGNAERNIWDLASARAHLDRCLDLAAARNDAALAAEARAELAMVAAQQILDEQADPQQALAVLDQTLQNDRAAPWLACEKGRLALEHGLHETAVGAFERCLAENAGDELRQVQARSGLAESLGHLAYEVGDPEAALAHFREWAELTPGEPWAHCTMADLLNWDLQLYEEALEAYRRCGELAQSDEEERRALENTALVRASMAARDERWDEAVAFYGEAISINPDAAYLYCERGNLFLELNDGPRARPDLQTCLELSRDDEALREWAEKLLREAEGQG